VFFAPFVPHLLTGIEWPGSVWLVTYGACVIAPHGRSTPGCMRYPDGDGLTAAGRARRESVRLQAAHLFEQDVSTVQVAHRLRVSTKPAYQWRRRWLDQASPVEVPAG
jgi:hypothetical protein